MSSLYVDANAWDGLTDVDRSTVVEAASVPVVLGVPAVQHGTFDVDGVFTPAENPPGAARRWYVWDDGRLTEDHALAIAAALTS